MPLTRVAPSLIAVANNVTSNVFGSANTIPSFTFDAQGVISTASNTAIQINTADIVNGSVSDAKIAAVANTKITGNIISSQITTVANTQLTGVLTGSQLPTGSVLQVVSATKTDTFSSTSTSFADVTGLTATITPSSTSSKILITASISHGRSSATLNHFKLLREATDIAIGDTGGSGTRSTIGSYLGSADSNSDLITSTIQFLDSPSTTSSTTYKIQTKVQDSGGTSYINRSGTDGAFGARTISTITVMEIKG